MSTAIADQQKAEAEKEAARQLVATVAKLEKALPQYESNQSTITEQLKEMQKTVDGFKEIDIGKTVAQVDQIRAEQATMRAAIKRSKNGLYVPGLDDEADKFSITRACAGVATKNWKNAGFEHEVFKAVGQVREKVGHISGVDSQGGYFVPDQVIPDVIQAIYTESVLIGLEGAGKTRVSVLDNLVGTPVRIPKFNGGMIAYWIGEQDKYAETASKVGNVTLTPKKMGLLTRMTDEIMRMSSWGYENLLRNDMVRAAAKLADWTMLYGQGTENMPRGVAYMPNINLFSAELGKRVGDGVTAIPSSANGGELTFDGLMEMQGCLEDQDLPITDQFAFIAHPRYFRRLKQLKVQFYSGQTTNQSYLLGVPFLTNDKLQSIIGDFDHTTQIGTTSVPGKTQGWTPNGGAQPVFGDVIGANWNETIFARWSGIEISDDKGEGSGFVSDQTFIKLRMYADVGHRQEKNIVWCPDAKMR